MNETKEIAVQKEREISPFELMDALDDQIIIEELQNRIVQDWVYHFAQGDKDIWGLSKKGVDQALEEIEKQGIMFEEISPTITYMSDMPFVNIIAQIRKYRYGKDGVKYDMGVFTGAKTQRVGESFWLEKGLSKAYRNAKKRCIPAEIEAKIISLAKEQGKVKNVEQPAQAPKKNTVQTQAGPDWDSIEQLIAQFNNAEGINYNVFWPIVKGLGYTADQVHAAAGTPDLKLLDANPEKRKAKLSALLTKLFTAKYKEVESDIEF